MKHGDFIFLDKCSNKLEGIVFHDDDTFCNPDKIENLSHDGGDDVTCLTSNLQFHRAHRFGKYKLSTLNWPAGYYIPSFCTGPGVLVSRASVVQIKHEFDRTAIDNFPLEDVLFTGIMRQKAGLTNIRDKSGTCSHLGDSISLETAEDLVQDEMKQFWDKRVVSIK